MKILQPRVGEREFMGSKMGIRSSEIALIQFSWAFCWCVLFWWSLLGGKWNEMFPLKQDFHLPEQHIHLLPGFPPGIFFGLVPKRRISSSLRWGSLSLCILQGIFCSLEQGGIKIANIQPQSQARQNNLILSCWAGTNSSAPGFPGALQLEKLLEFPAPSWAQPGAPASLIPKTWGWCRDFILPGTRTGHRNLPAAGISQAMIFLLLGKMGVVFMELEAACKGLDTAEWPWVRLGRVSCFAPFFSFGFLAKLILKGVSQNSLSLLSQNSLSFNFP